MLADELLEPHEHGSKWPMQTQRTSFGPKPELHELQDIVHATGQIVR